MIAGDKPLPFQPVPDEHVEESEASICSVAYQWPSHLEAISLPSEAFRSERYAMAWEALRKWPDETQRHEFARMDALLDLGWTGPEIAQLQDAEISPYKAPWHVTRIKKAFHIRTSYEACYKGMADIYTLGEADPERIADSLSSIEDPSEDKKNTTHLKKSIATLLDDLDKGSDIVSTGYDILNSSFRGFPIGTVSIIAARPGMGKSAFALNLARKQAKNGIPILYIGLEDQSSQYARRIIAAEGKINLDDFTHERLVYERDHGIDSGLGTHITRTAVKVAEYPIYLEDSLTSVSEIISSIRIHVKKNGVQAVYIDHIQEVDAEDSDKRDQVTYEIQANAKKFRDLAKRLNVSIILAAQINRETERRENKKPRVSDLRDSGSLEMIARLVLLLYREDFYEEDENQHSGNLEVIVGKANHGRSGQSISLRWEGQYCRVTG